MQRELVPDGCVVALIEVALLKVRTRGILLTLVQYDHAADFVIARARPLLVFMERLKLVEQALLLGLVVGPGCHDLWLGLRSGLSTVSFESNVELAELFKALIRSLSRVDLALD